MSLSIRSSVAARQAAHSVYDRPRSSLKGRWSIEGHADFVKERLVARGVGLPPGTHGCHSMTSRAAHTGVGNGDVGYWDAAVCAADVDSIVAALRYGIDLVGEDHVALGSDFDGSVVTPFDTSELVLLTDEMLRRGFTEPEIRKVMGGNLASFMAANLP